MNISREYFEEAKNLHHYMWTWLSQDGSRTIEQFRDNVLPYDFPDAVLPVEDDCFACVVAKELCTGYELICDNCPITDAKNIRCMNGLGYLYRNSGPSHRQILAGLIRDLPWDKNNVLDRIED